MLQPLLQDREPFVERHAGLEQMRELLGEDEQLRVRNLQPLRRRRRLPQRRGRRAVHHLRLGADRLDPDRDVLQLLDLPDGDRAVGTIQRALDQTTLSSCGRDRRTAASRRHYSAKA